MRTLTEQLAHGLREASQLVTAHLLVPGWTFTGMTSARGSVKPAGAWSAAQVVERMVESVDAGDFYIICPDNSVTSELDAARILWGARDLTENPAGVVSMAPRLERTFRGVHCTRNQLLVGGVIWAGIKYRPAIDQISAALAAIVALDHQSSSSNAIFAEGSRLVSISSMGLLPAIGKMVIKSPPLM